MPASVGFNASIEQEVSEASPATRQTLYRLEMSIEGMTCAACSGAVERCLLALDGVSSASVSLLQGRAEVFFDREVIDASAVSEAVEDIGFDATVLQESASLRRLSGNTPSEGGRVGLSFGDLHEEDQKELVSAVLHLECIASREEVLRAGGVGLIDVRDMQPLSDRGCCQSLQRAERRRKIMRLTYSPQEVGARTLLQRLRDANLDVAVPNVPPSSAVSADGAVEAARLAVAFYSTILPAAAAAVGLTFSAISSGGNTESLVMVTGMSIVAAWATFLTRAGRMYQSSAVGGIRRGSFSMDVLIATSTSVATVYGGSLAVLVAWELFSNSIGTDQKALHMLVHETVHLLAMAPLLLLATSGGKNVEHRARRRTAAALRELLEAQPSTALVKLGGVDGASRSSNESFSEIPTELLEIGDICRIVEGSRVPAEGLVVGGDGKADESLITGESALVPKHLGAPEGSVAAICLGGSTLAEGDVLMRVTAVGDATTLGQLTKMIARAQGSKPPSQRLADTLAARFVPFVLVLCLLSATIWLIIGFSGLNVGLPHSLALRVCAALQFGLAPMMLACPCAMGLATPTAISVAVGVAGQRFHCLVRDAAVLERGGERASRTAIVLDKTGTVTEGRPSVVAAAMWVDHEFVVSDGPLGSGYSTAAGGQRALESDTVVDAPLPQFLSDSESVNSATATAAALPLWQAIAAVEAVCPAHPVAAAVARYCEALQRRPEILSVREVSVVDSDFVVAPGDLERIAGRGVTALIRLANGNTSGSSGALASDTKSPEERGVRVSVGGPGMLDDIMVAHPEVPWSRLQAWAGLQSGMTLVYGAFDSGHRGACVLALRDPVRAEAPKAAKALLHAYGGPRQCEIWLCTGDNAASAAVAARALQLSPACVRAEQLPGQKCSLVQELQAGGASVIMVGDGLNDSPAIAQANVGVAIGAGAQLVCDAADVVLCRSSLLDLLAFRELCGATRRTIWRNFAWALGFNIIGLPLACGVGYPWGVTISPTVAGAAMAASSVLVVSSSLTLRSFRPSLSDQSVVTAIGARGKGTDVPSKPYMGRQLGRPFKSQFEEPLLIADVAQP
eukprot:TRINITY_DN2424_c0_g1_i1.p1 TRINITY_DN2424_c0_g1~~TRINITY_DN2424_c0_g1_i1.p1  ORF type:complete len:1100 (+),score=195.09 TRINITY_DN2424_c0_g1_i1:61-3300(+)